MNKSKTKQLTRAGVIAALYVVLTYAFQPISFNAVQARISEALTILPIFYFEAIPALTIGCVLANILSFYGAYDLVLGPFATLIAAIATYYIGKTLRNKHLKGIAGILPPVISNALIVPIIFILYGGYEGVYFVDALLVAAGELAVTATLGVLLYYGVDRMREKNIGVML